ncbi:hypothetical protein F4777DRAFT_578874 [Nemania sp. FL0916]|nr:hypothetical protein F4777DRAFT_578874 [Nemania sp. FL0916]
MDADQVRDMFQDRLGKVQQCLSALNVRLYALKNHLDRDMDTINGQLSTINQRLGKLDSQFTTLNKVIPAEFGAGDKHAEKGTQPIHANNPDGELAPLVYLITGIAIPGFPTTTEALQSITKSHACMILSELGIAVDGLSLNAMKETIRNQLL